MLSLSREAKRRWQHVLSGAAMLALSYRISRYHALWACSIATSALYYFHQYHYSVFQTVFGAILRDHERQNLPGAFWFVLGTSCTLACTSYPTAQYALAVLSVADPAAAWVGQSIPSPRLAPSASLAGCLACFASALLVGHLLLPQSGPFVMVLRRTPRLLASALACTVAEALGGRYDNWIIPLATGFVYEHV